MKKEDSMMKSSSFYTEKYKITLLFYKNRYQDLYLN